MGGVYDSLTGEIDELRIEVAREQLRLDLVDLYQADYLLYPEIWLVEAWSSAGVAKWDGVSQAVVGIGTRIINWLDAILNQYEGFLQPGVVDALSLGIVVESMEGITIFEHAGGIEVLKEAEDELRGDAMMYEAALSDSLRNRRAVEVALQPFLESSKSGHGN
jgi:hypothetical protein